MNGSDVAERLTRVRADIADATMRSGRAETPLLIGVSKTVEPVRVREAYDAGLRAFGENRVQEAVSKRAVLDAGTSGAVWYLIGHLQTNKARKAVETFDQVQSIDSVRVAEHLGRLASEAGRSIEILLEVNVAREPSKSGFQPDGLLSAMDQVLVHPSLVPRGLMTVAPMSDDPESIRWVFRRLRELRDEIADRFRMRSFSELSMGMSGDFQVAIEEGSTMVRIGRAIFGSRPVQ